MSVRKVAINGVGPTSHSVVLDHEFYEAHLHGQKRVLFGSVGPYAIIVPVEMEQQLLRLLAQLGGK
jgi:hypothetical protein